jgi:cytochrome P450
MTRFVTTPQHEAPSEPGYDPMRQFSELAGDVRDPYPMFAGIRAGSPVIQINLETRPDHSPLGAKSSRIPMMFAVFSHECVQQVLTDNVRFSSAGYAANMGQVMGRTILQMDPPEHMRYRALVAKAFRARVVDQWSDAVIGATVGELIDAFAADGRADLVQQLTFPFPVKVIARVLGLPEADWPRFLRLSTELIAIMRNWDRAVAASRELRGYFADIIADRRRNTRDDLVSQLIRAEVDGHRLTDDEIYPFLLLLLPAGAETTYRSSSNLLFGLLTHSDQLDAVRADRRLVPQAIEEALRWETPALTIMRIAAEDLELGGVSIPRGAFIAVSLGAANRDPARYADPDAFDIFRDPKQHISFGDGPHTCLGMHLARLETRVLLNAVLDRLPHLRLDPAATDPHIHGLVFRSPPDLPVQFDPASALTAPPGAAGFGVDHNPDRVHNLAVFDSLTAHVIGWWVHEQRSSHGRSFTSPCPRARPDECRLRGENRLRPAAALPPGPCQGCDGGGRPGRAAGLR